MMLTHYFVNDVHTARRFCSNQPAAMSAASGGAEAGRVGLGGGAVRVMEGGLA